MSTHLRLPIVLLLVGVLAAPLGLGPPASADPPQTISHQGRLTDEQGEPIGDNDYSLTCRIYDVPSGGAPLWFETQTIETLDGVYSLTLGADTPIDLPFDGPYWLGISFEGGAEMSPRIALTSSPYAFRAALADALAGGVPEDGDWTVSGSDMYAGVNGSVGIGTSDPSGKLTLADAEDTDLLVFHAGGADRFAIQAHGSGPDYLTIRSKFENPDTDIAVFRGDGRVGIGVVSPQAQLDVAGTVRTTGFQMTSAPSPGYVLTSDAAGHASWQAPGDIALPYEDSSDAIPQAFKITNTGAGTALCGEANSYQAYGLRGVNNANGAGVYGQSPSNNGAGVKGESPGIGVWGTSSDGYGVSGFSTNDTGVYAASTHGDGLHATSNNGLAAHVDGDLKVTGAYVGEIGPDNGAPFPRPAYDSG
ncbi:MAG: hypothetical protein GF330_11795, partial [Candidatus Eisenbacteria bacterium]|nr:hypothetical protein [Candidatus Eisenbacteria bacterium]